MGREETERRQRLDNVGMEEGEGEIDIPQSGPDRERGNQENGKYALQNDLEVKERLYTGGGGQEEEHNPERW